ncbi:hypothetical protein O181_063445 [Austropuccinia psidii MF-1]|uniref:Uncharacterized protein n=1 Tax=Austropuccinia psidii MF-1 TaxID=1389203 RepID=A0A9Q3ERA8_9BASI|nr:hypothetical protein [Austropuccinia psidii MF-1]
MANGPCHHSYGQFAHIGALWLLGHTTSTGHSWPQTSIYDLRPSPALIGLLGQLSTSPTPRPIPLVLGLGCPFSLPRALPLLLWAFGPFRPPTASMARGT